MSKHVYWRWLCRVCERAFVKHGHGITIPLESSDNPLKEFEATKVHQNVFRFIIFIMWMQHQPNSFQWFQLIRDHYSHLVNRCICQVTKKLAT